MAEDAPTHVGEDSPAHVAYKLLQTIASNENKSLHSAVGASATADRKWLVDTYAECLEVVLNTRSRLNK